MEMISTVATTYQSGQCKALCDLLAYFAQHESVRP
jgi:hypothetical protein